MNLCSKTIPAPALRLLDSVGFGHLPPERRRVSPYARADVYREIRLVK